MMGALILTLLSWNPYTGAADMLEVHAWVTSPVYTTCTDEDGEVFVCVDHYETPATLSSQLPVTETSLTFDHPPLDPGDVVFVTAFAKAGECYSQ